MAMYKATLISLSVVIGAARPVFIGREFNAHIEQGYQAAAHILVGVLLGFWWLRRERWAKRTFWTLTAIEVICAAITVAMKRGLL